MSISLPDQTIPESQKTEEWHISHAINYATSSGASTYDGVKKEFLKYYRAYNAELTKVELEATKHITCPHGTDLGIDYVVYPLIQSKIEQLVGEFVNRPLRRTAYVMDKKSKNSKFEKKVSMLSEEIMREYTEKMQKELGFTPETANQDLQLPKDIEEHFEKDFKMLVEETTNNLLTLFLDVRKEKEKLKEFFVDYCITDRAHALLDKVNGHTSLRKAHPMDADYDINPYQIVQEHEYFFENYWLTENEVYNIFPDLTADQKLEVKAIFQTQSGVETVSEDSDQLSTTLKYDGWYETSNKVGRLRLVFGMWKSRKRTSIKVAKNKKTGKPIYKKLNDESEARKKDKIENIDGEVPRHVIMLGPNICLSWGEMEQKLSTNDNPYRCTLPVVSIIRDNTTGTSTIKSAAAKLFQLQEIASEVLFEIRLALKSAGASRVLVYDAAQTPKEFTKGSYESGLNQVMHHIKKDRLMVINSAQKGSNKNTFNQFTSLDLSQKGAIQDLFNGLAIIEDLASKFIGISPEREGNVGQYQTASGAERAVRGSTARTEVIFRPFDQFIQTLLEKVILKMQHDYEENELIHFVVGDHKAKFIKLTKDFFLADLGCYISDSYKDQEIADTINRAAEMALSTSNTPEMVMGLIEVFEGESASEKKAVFARMVNTMERMRQEQAKAEQEAQERELQDRQDLRDQDMQKSREGNQTEKDVATIYANNKAYDTNKKTLSQERMKAAELFQKQQEILRNQKKPESVN